MASALSEIQLFFRYQSVLNGAEAVLAYGPEPEIMPVLCPIRRVQFGINFYFISGRCDGIGGSDAMLVGLPLLRVLDRMGCGGLVLATDGQVLAINGGARRILQEMFSLTETDLDDLHSFGRQYVKQLLSRGQTRIQLDSENWILIEREDRPPLIMNAVPVPILSEGGPHTVLILIDLATQPKPNQVALERIYGLTPAELKLAVLLGGGVTIIEAAERLRVSVATLRTQLRSIFDKTHTHRQAELVILIARLSALP